MMIYYYMECWRKYADFNGRARRTEFWMWYLVNGAIIFMLGVMFQLLGFGYFLQTSSNLMADLYYVFVVALSVMLIFPSYAVTARRLHDVGKSGWWLFIYLIPFGAIWLLVLLISDSDVGVNRYGPNPKGVGNPD